MYNEYNIFKFNQRTFYLKNPIPVPTYQKTKQIMMLIIIYSQNPISTYRETKQIAI